MSGDVSYRLARQSDISELVSLINSQYIRKKTGDYFDWQYFNSGFPTVLMCAFINDTIVGMFGLQKRRLLNGANVGQAIDLLVAPEWRGKGVFAELGRNAAEYFQDIDILCVFPNLNGKNASEKSLQWNTIGKIASMSLRSSNTKTWSVKSTEAISEAGTDYMLERFEYTEAIRRWRYARHPLYTYSKLQGTSATFLMTKVFTDPVNGKRYGDIVDFECPMENLELLQKLFESGVQHLVSQNVEMVTTWALPHSPLASVVSALGFIEYPQDRFFCVKVLKSKFDYLYDFTRWHLVQADSEIY